MNTQPILYAEDEQDDVFFMRRAFQAAGVANELVTVPDGQLAIEYLSVLGTADPLLMPCLVLLDLNLPSKSGLEVLKWIRSRLMFCTLPVLVMSSSDQDSDIQRAYAAGVNGYLVKPGNPQKLQSMVKALKDYWLTYNWGMEHSCVATRTDRAVPGWSRGDKSLLCFQGKSPAVMAGL